MNSNISNINNRRKWELDKYRCFSFSYILPLSGSLFFLPLSACLSVCLFVCSIKSEPCTSVCLLWLLVITLAANLLADGAILRHQSGFLECRPQMSRILIFETQFIQISYFHLWNWPYFCLSIYHVILGLCYCVKLEQNQLH